MRKIIAFQVIAAAYLLLTGCGQTEKENILVVSIEPQRALLEDIVGDKFEVVTLLTPGSNPETFEPGMNTRRQLESATAYFTTGYLPFEENIERASKNGPQIVNISAGITPVYGTHDHSGDHAHRHGHANSDSHGHDADPHVWTSPRNAKIMAKNMLDYVMTIDGANADYYEGRYQRLAERLDSLDAAYASRLAAPGVTKAFAIWHPSLSYFARDYGLEQISVGFENKEMPPSTLRKVIEEARADSVKVFFFQKEFDTRQAETINSELSTELITINPLDYDWQTQFDLIVSSLCR